MKVLFIEEAANLGGARIATVDLVANINKTGNIQARIIDISGTCKPFLEYCKAAGVDCQVVSPLRNPLIISSKSPIRRLINSVKFIQRFFRVKKKLRLIIKEEQPDFIILNGYRRLMYLWGYKGTAKICFYAHGWYIPQQISRFQKFLLKRIPHRIICVSEATKHAIYASSILPLNSIYVVHNGINIKTLPKGIATIPNSDGCFRILHSGGFTKGKSQLVSVEIARILKERGFKFKLVFTGIIYAYAESQDYYNEVLNKVKEYNLDNEVFFVVGKSNVIDYFRACDVLIHPSETEGLPLVVMEAMALKKPVIANSVGGVTDYILDGYTGFLPMHDNVNEYAEKIIKLATNKQCYDYISTNAYNLVSKHFTVDTQLESLMKIFLNNE